MPHTFLNVNIHCRAQAASLSWKMPVSPGIRTPFGKIRTPFGKMACVFCPDRVGLGRKMQVAYMM